MSLHTSRPITPTGEKESELELERAKSLSPIPTPATEECHRSTNSLFIKRWFRGPNTCSRCDFEFVSLRNLQSTRKFEEKVQKLSQHHSEPKKHRPPSACEAIVKDEKKPDFKCEKVSASPLPRKRPHYESGTSSDAQITSSLMGATPLPPYIMDHPAFRCGPGFGGPVYPRVLHDPTPALRQLSEYAKPHIDRNVVGPFFSLAGVDPFNRLYRSESKERLELESEKKERGAMRNRETSSSSSWEAKDKVKAETELKATQDRSLSYPTAAGLFDAQLFELQKRYGSAMPPGIVPTGLPANLPGIYPPTALTAEWVRREREWLELLGSGAVIQNLSPVDASILSDRLMAERLQAERMNERLLLPTDPMYRLEMGGGGGGTGAGTSTAAAADQAHTTHTHSHTHLHLHQPDATAAAAAAALYPPFHPLVSSSPHLLPSPGFALPGIRVASAGAPNTPAIQGPLPFGPPIPHPAYSFAASQQLMAAAREQELFYRELLSRPPYNTDPILAQQLMAQAIAHQEAIELQLSTERERFNAAFHGSMLPH